MKNSLADRAGKAAFALQDINEQEDIYIYKPWSFIFRLLITHYMRFCVLTLLSFYPLIFFVIPAWVEVLYLFYVALKLMKKYNLSTIKVCIFSVIIELGFIAISPLVRSGIKWIFFQLISGNFFT